MPKSQGGYRCPTEGEHDRRRFCAELHQSVLDAMSDDERLRVADEQKSVVSSRTQNFITKEASTDGLLRSAAKKSERAQRDFEEKKSRILIAYQHEGLDSALREADPSPQGLNPAEASVQASGSAAAQFRQSMRQSDKAQEVEAVFGRSQVRTLESRATLLAQWTPEAQKLQKARVVEARAHGDALSVRAEEVGRVQSPTFKEALKRYSATEQGKAKLVKFAEHCVVTRYSPKQEISQSTAAENRELTPTQSFKAQFNALHSETTPAQGLQKDFRALQYEEGRKAVGDRNRCQAYIQRLNEGKTALPGETIPLSGEVSVIHPRDTRSEPGLYREGTPECAQAVLGVYRHSNEKFRELTQIEIDRVTGKDHHEDRP